MIHYKVPGVSVAIIEGCKVALARGFGVKGEGGGAVAADTLFQAASISKPVAALGALRLVEQGKLTLDTDIRTRMRGWTLPENDLMRGHPVTLRGLLSHGGGLTVHGFGGYPAGDSVPTVAQILDGLPPANSAPVRVDKAPGSGWRYSGGGYTVAQLLMTEAANRDFAGLMKRLVLGPLGMAQSTYQQPLPAAWEPRAARGHVPDGTMVKGRWHTYPELAAAGLWTTPSDLARFAIDVIQADRGQSDAILSPRMADDMLRKQTGDFGLGVALGGEGEARSFSHGGANAGYRAQLLAFPETCQGAVVMTNSDNGGPLITEVMRALADTYGWPDAMKSREVTRARLDRAQLSHFVGAYQLTQNPDVKIDIAEDGSGGIDLSLSGGPRKELWAESPTRLVSPDDGIAIERTGDPGTAAQALTVEVSATTRYEAKRVTPPQ
ncbi:MAG: beta-lactamase family protein [Novosphingobium sp.]|nr:beta-lactamase family protein [Novosphingobium sp.]